MFGFQGTKNQAKLEKELGSLRAKRAAIADRLATTQSEIEGQRRAAVAAALNGGRGIDEAEASKRTFEDRAQTLTAALGSLDADVADAEGKLTAAKDAATRAASIAALTAMSEAYAAALPDFLKATAALRAVAEKSGSVVFEANNLANFLGVIEGDIPRAIEAIRSSLGFRVNEIRLGGGTPSLPPAPARPEPAMPPPPMEETRPVTLLYASKWTGYGAAQSAAAGDLVLLPIATAARAVDAGVAAVERSDRRVEAVLARVGNSLVADAHGVIDLDADVIAIPPPAAPRLRPRRV